MGGTGTRWHPPVSAARQGGDPPAGYSPKERQPRRVARTKEGGSEGGSAAAWTAVDTRSAQPARCRSAGRAPPVTSGPQPSPRQPGLRGRRRGRVGGPAPGWTDLLTHPGHAPSAAAARACALSGAGRRARMTGIPKSRPWGRKRVPERHCFRCLCSVTGRRSQGRRERSAV